MLLRSFTALNIHFFAGVESEIFALAGVERAHDDLDKSIQVARCTVFEFKDQAELAIDFDGLAFAEVGGWDECHGVRNRGMRRVTCERENEQRETSIIADDCHCASCGRILVPSAARWFLAGWARPPAGFFMGLGGRARGRAVLALL